MVSRVVSILHVFDGAHSSLGLAEISTRTGLPKSSTFRILQQLVEARMLEKAGRQYRLGLGIFELGSLVPHRNRLVATSRPHLQELSIAGRFAAHLAILDGEEVVYLDKAGGRFAGVLPSRVGGRFVAHNTGVGKAILANAAADVVAGYLDAVFAGQSSAHARQAFEAELNGVRRAGYAVEHGQALAGVSCIAAPVTHRGIAIAAISISAPTQHLDVARLTTSVRMSATSISRGLAQSRTPAVLAS